MSVLESIFRSRRAPSRHRHRVFRPVLDGLEDRKLMDGATTIISLTGPSVVGRKFQLQALDTNGLPFAPGTVASVRWTITGVLDGRTVDSSGFHDIPFGNGTTKTQIGAGSDVVTGYWDGSTSPHSITATVCFTPLSIVGVPYPSRTPETYASTWTVNAPNVQRSDINFQPIAAAGPHVDTATNDLSVGTGVKFDVNIDKTYGGSFGVIQTFQSSETILSCQRDSIGMPVKDPNTGQVITTSQSVFTNPDGTNPVVLDGTALNVNGTPLQPPSVNPLLSAYSTPLTEQKWIPGGNGGSFENVAVVSPYYSTQTSANMPYTLTVNAGTTLPLEDGPETVFNRNTYEISREDHFTDTVIYTPTGGIPVAIGSFEWTWNADVRQVFPGEAGLQRLSSGGPMIEKPYAPTSQLPTWAMSSPVYYAYGWFPNSTHRNDPQLAAPAPTTTTATQDPRDAWDIWDDPYPSRDPYPIW